MLRVVLAALFLAALPALAQTVTVTLKGHLVLKRDGVTISSHNTERDAVEKAINSGPGTYRIVQPEIEVVVKKPVVISSIEGKPPIVYYPACVTSDCRGPTKSERTAVRAQIAANTAAWTATPANREKMRWPTSGMYLPPPR